MCISKRWIKNVRGRDLLVNCGHCPACLQEKALLRTNRIRANYFDHIPEGLEQKTCLFVTLTYRNECCPYFRISELWHTSDTLNVLHDSFKERPNFDRRILDGVAARPAQPLSNDVRSFRDIHIYRDAQTTWIRSNNTSDGKYRVRRHTKRGTIILRDVSIPTGLEKCNFKPLKKYGVDKIGVIYYADVQNFIKNLRNVLQRNFHIFVPFEFFCCAEYGPTTCRPHFHILIFFQGSHLVPQFQAACAKAWPYDDFHRTFKFCEVARNAASYVSSYVNCDSSVPLLFKDVRCLRQNHSYSKGFGLALSDYSFSEILRKIERHDLRVYRTILRKNTPTDVSYLLPKYTLDRYFPKFKGYYRLTSDEIFVLLLHPERIYEFAKRCELIFDDASVIQTMLRNRLKRVISEGVSPYDYALAGSRVWSIYAANVLEDFYNSLDCPTSNFTAYDNIIKFYNGELLSVTLDDVLFEVPPSFHYETDPNLFPDNLFRHQSMVSSYASYSKDRKVRNAAYSQFYNL